MRGFMWLINCSFSTNPGYWGWGLYENFEMHQCPLYYTVILTLGKIKTALSSLKADVEKALHIQVVYRITCSRCLACYVGETDRHKLVWLRRHTRPSQPISKHLRECVVKFSCDNKYADQIIQATVKIILFLEALEALWQREIKPLINTRDEYKHRQFTIKF